MSFLSRGLQGVLVTAVLSSILGCIDPDFISSSRSTLVGEGTYSSMHGDFRFELMRLNTTFAKDGLSQATYIQYFPSPGPAPTGSPGLSGPMVVYTIPYDGIAWSGEAIDQIASPGIMDPQTAGNEALPYLQNGIGVTFVYGRFFAGESSENDVRDVRAALNFLRKKDYKAQTSGIHGASWGGYMALFGAAHGELKPQWGSIWFPPSDLKDWVSFIQSHPHPGTFQYHLAALTRTFGDLNTSEFAGFRYSDLVAKLSGRYQIVHDEWDTLVPISFSRRLTETSPVFEGIWRTHSTPVDLVNMSADHHPLAPQWLPFLTPQLTWIHLISGLSTRPTIELPVDGAALLQFLYETRLEQLRGLDIDWLRKPLIQMTDARVYYTDGTTGVRVSGAELISDFVNSLWGLHLAPDDIQAYLISNAL